jgi:hypothetical protein
MAWRSYVVLLDDHRFPRLLLNGAMYIIVGESKTVPFLGLAKSRYPLATSFTASRINKGSQWESSVFAGDRHRSRSGIGA